MSSLHLLTTSYTIQEGSNEAIFQYEELEKNARPDHVRGSIPVLMGPPEMGFKSLLEDYIAASARVRRMLPQASRKRLFVSLTESHARVLQPATLASDMRAVMATAGIDTDKFKAHSVRSAAVNQAKRQGLQLKQILKLGNWKSRTVFKRHYDLQLDNNDSDGEDE